MFVLILMGVVFVIFIIIRIVQKIQDDIYELEYREDTKMYEKLRRDEINSSGVIIDHDDYFEFVHPIGDVHMVAKHGYSQNEESWDYAMWLATRNKSGGFQDWRLPTIEELKKLHENRHVINEILRREFLSESTWWSSSEDSKTTAFGLIGDCSGEVFSDDKSSERLSIHVR